MPTDCQELLLSFGVVNPAEASIQHFFGAVKSDCTVLTLVTSQKESVFVGVSSVNGVDFFEVRRTSKRALNFCIFLVEDSFKFDPALWIREYNFKVYIDFLVDLYWEFTAEVTLPESPKANDNRVIFIDGPIVEMFLAITLIYFYPLNLALCVYVSADLKVPSLVSSCSNHSVIVIYFEFCKRHVGFLTTKLLIPIPL